MRRWTCKKTNALDFHNTLRRWVPLAYNTKSKTKVKSIQLKSVKDTEDQSYLLSQESCSTTNIKNPGFLVTWVNNGKLINILESSSKIVYNI